MNILVINCGSSSLKIQFIQMETKQATAVILCDRIGEKNSKIKYSTITGEKREEQVYLPTHAKAIRVVLAYLTDAKIGVIQDLSEIHAVGHRVVHGAEIFSDSIQINETVMEQIEACAGLAPLHNPANISGIIACQELLSMTPQVAVFDTAFHQTMPSEAYFYGIPYRYYKEHGVRRYGFHGTSHCFVSKQAAIFLQKDFMKLKMIVCHLGNGASVTAVRDGKSIDTSMGLTPLEGLIMGTRSGDLDPAIIEFIAHKEKKTMEDVVEILNKKSGVLGLSEGLSSDFRDLLDGYQSGHAGAIRAINAYTYRIAKYIGAYAVAMGGLDAIVFTAGIGENSGLVRELICNRLEFLGATLDHEQNNSAKGNRCISKDDSKVELLVIPTNEELSIAEETCKVLGVCFDA